MDYPNLSQRVFHTPLMVTPAKAASFVMGLGPRILGADQVSVQGAQPGVATPEAPRPFASILDGRLSEEIRVGKRNGYAVRDGVALVPVTGTLIHRGAWVGSFSGETSYEGIGAQVDAALEDSRVRAIALEIDSFGGEVAGCFSLARQIRKARALKPVRAFVADHAFSAAYALASQADRVIVPRAGGAGSIGVICMHADYSGQLEQLGVSVTVIAAGAHKDDGNPYAPLPESVRGSLQSEMESLRAIFAETVAAGRGKALDVRAALATQAACFLGQDAVAAGLADEVADPADAFAQFVSEINGRGGAVGPLAARAIDTDPTFERSKTMKDGEDRTDDEPAGGDVAATGAETTGVSDTGGQPAAESGAGADSPKETAPAAGTGKDDERKRVAAILRCEEAKGREELAQSFAFDSDMSAEQARRHLAAAPKGAPQRTLSESMSEEDTDLELPEPAAAGENPVKAAHKRAKGA